MRSISLVAVVLGTGLLICCAPRVQPGAPLPPPPASPSTASEEIRISRGPCFGFCPVYKVAVTPAGRVDFTGERHTTVLGPRSRSVGPAVYEELRKAMQPLRPETGKESVFACSTEATDMSQLTIEWVAANGVRTALTYNMGCRDEAGGALAQTVEDQLRRLEIDGWASQKTWPGESRG